MGTSTVRPAGSRQNGKGAPGDYQVGAPDWTFVGIW